MITLREAWNLHKKDSVPSSGMCTQREKKLLLAHVCGISPSRLDLFGDNQVEDAICREFSRLLALRARGVPLQYLLGEWEFFSLTVKMKRGVFIPRRDTEVWLEYAITRLREKARGKPIMILDMACGTGAIAVASAVGIPSATVWGVDISPQAIHLARENALLNGVNDRTHFMVSHLYQGLEKRKLKNFDAMLANPPYLSCSEWETLSTDIKEHEPRQALVGGKSGLECIEAILSRAHHFLVEGAFLFLEHSPWQRNPVLAIAEKSGNLEFRSNIADFSGKIRATELQVIA